MKKLLFIVLVCALQGCGSAEEKTGPYCEYGSSTYDALMADGHQYCNRPRGRVHDPKNCAKCWGICYRKTGKLYE